MQRLKHLPRPVWLTAGVIAGLVAVPAVTVAATATIVNIQGNGHTASVSPGGQLRTIEMDPSTFTHLRGSTGTCKDLGTASTSRAYIIRDVTFDDASIPASGDFASTLVLAGPSCGSGSQPVADAQFQQAGSHEVHLGDGVALPAGTHLWLSANGGNVTANVYGYTITPNAVPNTAAAVRRVGPAKG